jgi:hypothetical protein
MSVLQATPSVMATAMMQVYQSRNATLPSRAKRVQSSLQNMRKVPPVLRQDTLNAVVLERMIQEIVPNFTLAIVFVMMYASNLGTAARTLLLLAVN